MRLVLAGTFLCIGTVGNILSIVTVTNKHCKKSSYTVYLAGLAIADLLTLYFAILAIPLPETFGSNLTVRSALFCKLHLYFLYLFSGVSIWLIVILALERTFAVYFPFKAKSVCKPKTALITIALLVAVFSVLNSHYLYGMQIQSAGSPNDDSFKPPLDWNAFTKFDRHENVSLPPFDNSSNEDGNGDDDDSFNIDDIFSREEIMTNAGVVMGQERDTTDHPLTTICNSTETKSGKHFI